MTYNVTKCETHANEQALPAGLFVERETTKKQEEKIPGDPSRGYVHRLYFSLLAQRAKKKGGQLVVYIYHNRHNLKK